MNINLYNFNDDSLKIAEIRHDNKVYDVKTGDLIKIGYPTAYPADCIRDKLNLEECALRHKELFNK